MIKNGRGTNASGAKVVAPFLFYGLDWSLNKWKKSLEKNLLRKSAKVKKMFHLDIAPKNGLVIDITPGKNKLKDIVCDEVVIPFHFYRLNGSLNKC